MRRKYINWGRKRHGKASGVIPKWFFDVRPDTHASKRRAAKRDMKRRSSTVTPALRAAYEFYKAHYTED
jgi:hypothetical protein